jgi:hypothetical protein
MLKGYKLLSAVCKFTKDVNFEDFGWEAQFPGTTEQFDKLVTELKDVAARERYLGLEGYKKFSESWAGKDMLKGYILLSAVCKFTKDVNFEDFGWEAAFPGTTEQFDKLVTELKHVTARERYLGLEGYKKFSESWAGKDMKKGYKLLSAVCALCGDRKLFSALNWPAQFSGTVKQFDFIHTTLSELGERLDPLKGVSKDYRLVALHELLQRLPKGELIADLPVEALFAALPERIGSLNRGDFSTACMRLTV